jgi:hypothetical protein
MAEQSARPPTDAELEALLRDVAAHLAYPPTPPIAAAVRRRLAERPRPASPVWAGWFTRRRLAVALLMLLLLAGSWLALTPGALTAVAERLGLRGVTIEFVPAVPTPTPSPTPAATPAPTATPVPVGARLSLGRAVSLAEARQRAAYPVAVPALAELGAPDEVYVEDTTAGRPVALVYRPRPGWSAAPETGVALLLVQLQGALEPQFFGKGLGPESRLEEIELNGRRAFWIEGRPHFIFIRDPNGVMRDETVRLAGNVLLWEDGPVTYRLEGAPTKADALRVAASMTR